MQAIYLEKPSEAGDKVPNVFAKSLAEFRSERYHPFYGEMQFDPPTGLGRYWARYDAHDMILRVTLPIYFSYEDYDQLVDPTSGALVTPERPVNVVPVWQRRPWPASDRERFQRTVVDDIRNGWSRKFAFRCTVPGWTDQLAHVEVRVDVAEETDPRVPWFATCKRFEQTETPGGSRDTVVGHGLILYGDKILDPDLQQRRAVHEAGHMFGLGDEYVEEAVASRHAGAQPVHGRFVEAERVMNRTLANERPYGGYSDAPDVVVADDQRSMSIGNEILIEHYITFLMALRSATAIDVPPHHWVLDRGASP